MIRVLICWPAGGTLGRMIPKSGHRFSDKVMCKR
jgi:hypothetical protein